MTNVLLPLVYYLLNLGSTIDLRTYDMGYPSNKPIYNSTDYVENKLNILNSSYYVLPDGNIPYSALRVPIDIVLNIKSGAFGKDMLSTSKIVTSQIFDSAALLLVTEYKSLERSVKANASPTSDWQKHIPESHTHYVDKMIYGSNCIAFITIRSNVTGDVQIFRKILTDVMGAKGSIGEGTADLWAKAMKTMKESPEVRGDVYVAINVVALQVDVSFNVYNNVESLLRYLSDFLKHVNPPPSPGENRVPLYASFKPLHNLDERYVSLEKNLESEKDLLKLDLMEKDAEFAHNNLLYFDDILDDEAEKKFNVFVNKVRSARTPIRKLMYSDLSIYKDIDLPAFKNAFLKYQQGLDNTTENYFAAFKKLNEEIGVRCENIFLKPVSGYLRVQDNEIVDQGKVEGGLKECQDLCFEDKRCRAVGYAEQNKHCLTFYRSTSSATIATPLRHMLDMKTYDRKCK